MEIIDEQDKNYVTEFVGLSHSFVFASSAIKLDKRVSVGEAHRTYAPQRFSTFDRLFVWLLDSNSSSASFVIADLLSFTVCHREKLLKISKLKASY